MSPRPRWTAAAAIVALLAWTGVVLWRFQAVQSPEPLVGVALVAAWLAVLTLACLGGGRLAVRLAAPAPAGPRLARAVVELALGAGVLAATAGSLGAVGWLRPLPLLLVLVALAVAGASALRSYLPASRPLLPPALRLPALLLAVTGTLTLLTAATPSPFYDQLHYHLAFPFQWLRHGRIEVFPRQAYSYFPATIGLLYTYALAALGAGAAQAVHWWLGGLAVAGTGALAAALRGPRAGWWAAALLATTPSVMLLATWAAADLAILAFTVAALLMLLLAARDARLAAAPGWWVLIGALAGLAAGCKYLAVLTAAVPIAVAVFAAQATGAVRRLQRLALAGLGGLLSFGPWLLRNAVATGDPVYPFLAGRFPPHGAVAAADLAEVAAKIPGIGWSRPGLAQLASLTTFSPVGDAGSIGPAYLALLPLAAWAAWRGRRSFAAVLAAAWLAATAGWAAGPPTGRYLLPAVAILAVLAGVGVQRALRAAPRAVRPWLTGGLAAVLAWSALGGTTPLELSRLACTLGRGSTDEIMTRYASYWPAVRLIDRELPAGAKLLLVGESRTMYIDRDVVVDDPFVTPLLVTLAESAPSARAIAAELRGRGVTHVLFNRHEAARIAALNRRSDYFAPLSPAGRARLEELFRSCLRPVATAGPVELLALAGCEP